MEGNAIAQVYNLLENLDERDKINLDDVQNIMTKLQKIKEVHYYDIWQAKDGRYKTYVPDATKKTGRRLVVKQKKADLYDFLLDFYHAQQEEDLRNSLTLEEIYPQWLDHKGLHTTAKSYILRIQSDWNTYYEGTDITKIPIVKLTKLELDTWAHKLIKDYSMTKNNYYNVTLIMRQSLDYAVDLGIIDDNTFSKVKVDGGRLFRKVKKKASQTQVFTVEEEKKIAELAWKDFFNKVKRYELAPLAVLFQFETGLRIGELCALRYEDLEAKNYVHVQRMVRRDTREVVDHTKSDYGDRQVVLTPAAKKIIETAKARQQELNVSDDGYIFSIDGNYLPERAVSTLYSKYCKKMDICQKSSHKARKTYISTLLDNDVNVDTVRELVGHADERTTFNNYCFDRSTETEKEQAIINALSQNPA